jgi:TRAP transporter 4TM/12TM fusion protein
VPPAGARRRGRLFLLLNGALAVAAIVSFGYLAVEHESIVRRVGAATPLDIAMGALALGSCSSWRGGRRAGRSSRWPGCALGYAFAGPWLPGALAHRGYGARRLIEHLYLSTEGVWGVPLGVSADFVFLFILFGALLQAAGGGELLVALAARLTGRLRGGTALTATVASGLMGSLSGSAVANVATTGAVTIPLMQRAGFGARQAAAIEAAASTGGQLVPPVMGAGAFIMATWTNIPYAQVALAALLPALLYYLALLVMILFRAVQLRLPPGDCAVREAGGRAPAPARAAARDRGRAAGGPLADARGVLGRDRRRGRAAAAPGDAARPLPRCWTPWSPRRGERCPSRRRARPRASSSASRR